MFGEGVRLICRKLRDGRAFKATEFRLIEEAETQIAEIKSKVIQGMWKSAASSYDMILGDRALQKRKLIL